MGALASYVVDQGVVALTMDDGKVNVVDRSMLEILHCGLDKAEETGSPLMLAGRTGVFSGGFDLHVLESMTTEAVELLRDGFELCRRLLAFPTPVVVACTGHAVALGMFMVLSCDYRIGAVGTPHRLVANEVANGMTVPRSGIEIGRHRLTPATLQRAMLLSETFTPEDAVVAGILDEVVSPDELLSTALRRARGFGQLRRGAFAATKARLREHTLGALAAAIVADVDDLRRHREHMSCTDHRMGEEFRRVARPD